MIVRKLFNETMFTISDDDYEYDPKNVLVHCQKLSLGGYEYSRINRVGKYNLYLCDNIVTTMPYYEYYEDFDGNVCYCYSNVRRWLNEDFYNTLSEEEKSVIERVDGDKIFLLDKDTYIHHKNIIKTVNIPWWLGSNFNHDKYVYIVDKDGRVAKEIEENAFSDFGVRPAVIV